MQTKHYSYRGTCRHCLSRNVRFVGRGLCHHCHEDLSIRAQHPTLVRRGNMAPPTCKHCGGGEMKFGSRGLCRRCYKKPHIRDQYPRLRETQTVEDCNRATMEMLETYPDHTERAECPCGQSFDGLCAPCERAQRAGLAIKDEPKVEAA